MKLTVFPYMSEEAARRNEEARKEMAESGTDSIYKSCYSINGPEALITKKEYCCVDMARNDYNVRVFNRERDSEDFTAGIAIANLSGGDVKVCPFCGKPIELVIDSSFAA